MRRIVVLVMVLAGVAAVAAAAGYGQARTDGQTLVLRLDLTNQALRHFGKGVGAGDVFVDRLSVESDGKPDGHGHESCTVTFPVRKTSLQLQCDEFLSLSDGTITAQGIVHLDFAKGGPQPASFAVTGGTRAYDGARGEIRTKPVGRQEEWTVQLLP